MTNRKSSPFLFRMALAALIGVLVLWSGGCGCGGHSKSAADAGGQKEVVKKELVEAAAGELSPKGEAAAED